MTNTSTTSITTAKASSYLQQLCKHFSHKIEADFSPESGWIKFDFGRAELTAEPDALTMTAEASNDTDLARLQNVLATHLERFAFREVLLINWSS